MNPGGLSSGSVVGLILNTQPAGHVDARPGGVKIDRFQSGVQLGLHGKRPSLRSEMALNLCKPEVLDILLQTAVSMI
jgi:hypothetical protein